MRFFKQNVAKYRVLGTWEPKSQLFGILILAFVVHRKPAYISLLMGKHKSNVHTRAGRRDELVFMDS